ncbi:MAG: hypothetical protein U1F17_10470 [Burkholderiaceae bacterium]
MNIPSGTAMPRELLLAPLCVTPCVFAQPSPEAFKAEVTDNVATEYAECAAYFAIVQGAFESSGRTAEATKYKEVSDKAFQFSFRAAQQSRNEEMAGKVSLARFETSLKEMQKVIDYDYSNISLLMNRHSTPCVEAMKDSGVVIRRWTERVDAKRGFPITK